MLPKEIQAIANYIRGALHNEFNGALPNFDIHRISPCYTNSHVEVLVEDSYGAICYIGLYDNHAEIHLGYTQRLEAEFYYANTNFIDDIRSAITFIVNRPKKHEQTCP